MSFSRLTLRSWKVGRSIVPAAMPLLTVIVARAVFPSSLGVNRRMYNSSGRRLSRCHGRCLKEFRETRR
jgi:hypothetical protein